MKDVVPRYTFDKCWPNSVNKSLGTMVLAPKLLTYIQILPVLKVQLKFHLLKALPSSLNSSLRILRIAFPSRCCGPAEEKSCLPPNPDVDK